MKKKTAEAAVAVLETAMAAAIADTAAIAVTLATAVAAGTAEREATLEANTVEETSYYFFYQRVQTVLMYSLLFSPDRVRYNIT